MGTTHDEYKPTQDAVHPDIVDLYEEALESERFERSAAFKRPSEDSDDKMLDDGHHSYVASRRAEVDIDIEDMGINELLAYEEDWSEVEYRRFLDFETFLVENDMIHSERLTALIAAVQAGNAEDEVAALRNWEVNLLLSRDDRYDDVWEAADDIGYSGELQEMLDEQVSGGGQEDEEDVGDEEDQDEIIPEDSSDVEQPGDSDGSEEANEMNVEPPVRPIANAYFWHLNYGLGSQIHGYMENAQVQVLPQVQHGFNAVRLLSADLPLQYQSFTLQQPPLPAIGQIVWMNSADLQ